MQLPGYIARLKPVFIVLLAIFLAWELFGLNHVLTHKVVMQSGLMHSFIYSFPVRDILSELRFESLWLRPLNSFFTDFRQYTICGVFVGFLASFGFDNPLFKRVFIWALLIQPIHYYLEGWYLLYAPIPQEYAGEISNYDIASYRYDILMMFSAEALSLIACCLFCSWLRQQQVNSNNINAVWKFVLWPVLGFISCHFLLLGHLKLLMPYASIGLDMENMLRVVPMSLNYWKEWNQAVFGYDNLLLASTVSAMLISFLLIKLSPNRYFFRGFFWGVLINFASCLWIFRDIFALEPETFEQVLSAFFEILSLLSVNIIPLLLCSVFFWYGCQAKTVQTVEGN